MARTTATLVQSILEETATMSLTTFIGVATLMVTKNCATRKDSNGDVILDDDELEMVERYLAAHFYHVTVTRADMEKADVSETKRSKVDLGLNLTHYGQQAMLLDRTGALAALNSHKVSIAKMTWMGTEDYDENNFSKVY